MSEQANVQKPSFAKEMWDLFIVIIQALGIALVLRTFVFVLVTIPTASMVPTLWVGDYLYVTKYAYGYSKHSFPFSAAPFSGRVFGTQPKLGDIVVFKGSDGTEYIKRLVGLPADSIQVTGGILYINGKAAPLSDGHQFQEFDKFGISKTVERLTETLPNGIKHNVLNYGNTRADNTKIFEIPAGHYFMMGDSRDNSNDSRFQDVVKMVPFEAFIGRADYILLSFALDTSFWEIWKWPANLRTNRMFSSLDNIID